MSYGLLENNMISSSNESKKKILLVEDDTFILEMYATKLLNFGYEVLTAVDGEEALKIVKEKHPDFILLDLVLPSVDGFEVLKKIKKDPKTKSIPVILLTNLGEKQDVEQGLKLGADDYLIKAHFTPSEVIEKIQNLLK